MTIIELERTEKSASASATLTVQIADKVYLLIAGPAWMTVVAGKTWIDAGPRRSMGKTFHRCDDLRNHYKKHGVILAELCREFGPWKESAE